MLPGWVRRTTDDKVAGTIRRFLGILFVSTGLMKVFVPVLAHSWARQLEAASIPFDALNLWLIPAIEVLIGILLILGTSTRIAAALAIPIMMVAIYAHLVVQDATLFPMEPKLPVVPTLVLILSFYLLWRGGGSWSVDLKISKGQDV